MAWRETIAVPSASPVDENRRAHGRSAAGARLRPAAARTMRAAPVDQAWRLPGSGRVASRDEGQWPGSRL